MDELKQLYEERARIMDRISDIECEQRQQKYEAFVGKCFVYMNSYSGSEQWPLYSRVDRIDENGWLIAFQFQTDCHGRIEIKPEETKMSVSAGYEEISQAEFDAAWKETLERVRAASGKL